MTATTHRKDLTFGDFHVLHRFRWAFQCVRCEEIVFLNERVISLPTWASISAEGGYEFRDLATYPREVYFVPIRAFRRLCRYAGLEPGLVLNTMFRLSMIAVSECTSATQFQVQFLHDITPRMGAPLEACGYIIEKRRLVESAGRKRRLR